MKLNAIQSSPQWLRQQVWELISQMMIGKEVISSSENCDFANITS